MRPAPSTAATNGSQPALVVEVAAVAPLANSEWEPAVSDTWPLLFSTSISPVRCASRDDTGTPEPARTAWSVSVLRRNAAGATAKNGSTGTTNPAITPAP